MVEKASDFGKEMGQKIDDIGKDGVRKFLNWLRNGFVTQKRKG